MANDKVSIWNQYLKAFRQPTSGEVMFGNGTDFTLGSLSAAIDAAFPSATQGSILYRGATDWTYLPPGSAGQVLQSGGPAANPGWATGYSPPSVANNTIISNVSGSSAAPSANTLTQVLDSVAGNTQGSILYRSGTAWTVLGPGSSGQSLVTNGTGANPSWTTVGDTRIYKTSDQSVTSNASYTDATELSFSVAANAKYSFTVTVYVNMTGGGGVGIAMNGPTSPTYFLAGISGYVGVTAYNSDIFIDNTGGRSDAAQFYGLILNGSNAGTMTVRIRQYTSNASATILKEGSYIEYSALP